MRRVLATLTISLALLGMSTLLPNSALAPRPAFAGCWDNGCNGQDPYRANCAFDGYSVDSIYEPDAWGNTVGVLSLEHTPSCAANFVLNESWIGSTWLYAENDRSDGLAYGFIGYDTVVASPLLGSFGMYDRGCGQVKNGGYWGPFRCTNWRYTGQ